RYPPTTRRADSASPADPTDDDADRRSATPAQGSSPCAGRAMPAGLQDISDRGTTRPLALLSYRILVTVPRDAARRGIRKLPRLDPDCQRNRLATAGGEVRRVNQGGHVAMPTRPAAALAIFAALTFSTSASAQDLGPNVRKLADGV